MAKRSLRLLTKNVLRLWAVLRLWVVLRLWRNTCRVYVCGQFLRLWVFYVCGRYRP